MSTLVGCCCADVKGFFILQPCHLAAVTTKYMTASDWAACSFNYGTVYKNGYCGYWRPSATVGGTLDNTCGNYTANTAGCCGSGFDPCPDVPACCGYQECMEIREANSQTVPLTVTGFSSTSGSAGSSWTATVAAVSVGTPTFYNPGTADFRYKVSGTISVAWTSAPSGTIDCDDSDRPPTRSVPFEFYVVHDDGGGSCVQTATADSTTDPCDYSVSVCPGTTTTTGSGFSACDILRAEPDSASMTSGQPSFGNDCSTPGSQYELSLVVGVDLEITNPVVDDCVPGCSGSGWTNAYFPDVNTTVGITLAGAWS